MKITFVNFDANMCGSNRALFEVSNGLIERSHEVDYLALQPNKWFPLKTEIKVCQNPQELKDNITKSDIVLATGCMTAYIVDAVKDKKGVPTYYCQHYEPMFFIRPEEQVTADRTYDLPLNLITNSPWLQQQLREKHNRESNVIVPGVDHEVFQQKALQKNPDVLKVMTIASSKVFKGFYDTVLPAFQFVSLRLKNVEFHLFGNIDLPIPYEFNVVKHHHLKDDELAQLYNSCDLFVSGSWAESSPIAHLEALACGCPVVSTPFGTEHLGVAIERVPPRAPRALGAKIVELLEDSQKRVEMTEQGLTDVQKFSWNRTAEEVEYFFKNLLEESA
jgi:glycosyltransferase involved in cell wall biosynthesis